MTKTKTKPYHHGDLRSALLAAAEVELGVSGYEKFSLRKVAARAGVSHAAPAHHFGDTQGLLTALAVEGFKRFLKAMQDRGALADPEPRAQLIAAGLGYLDFAEKEKALFRLIHASERPAQGDACLIAAGTDAYMHLLNLVVQTTGGSCEDTQAHLDAASVWAMAHGIADLVTNGRMQAVTELAGKERDAMVTSLLERSLPLATEV